MIIIAYGANLNSSLGCPETTYAALPALLAGQGVKVIKASSLYATAPVPVSDQPEYKNAAMLVETSLAPRALLGALMAVEKELGRVRFIPNEARGIDLDIIAYHDVISDEKPCMIPHPRMHQRRFVLEPLLEIAPEWVHPILNKSAESLLTTLSHHSIAA